MTIILIVVVIAKPPNPRIVASLGLEVPLETSKARYIYIYICLFICIYTYYTYAYIYIYIYIGTYICMYLSLSISLYIYVYIYIYTYVYTHICVPYFDVQNLAVPVEGLGTRVRVYMAGRGTILCNPACDAMNQRVMDSIKDVYMTSLSLFPQPWDL